YIMKNRILILSLLLVLGSAWLTSCSQVIGNDPYNLRFDSDKHNWQPNGSSMLKAIAIDNAQTINGKHPLLIRRNLQNAMWNTASISQRIILSQTITDSVHVSIHNSCGYLTKALLYVWRYNDKEEFVSKDSIDINVDGWHNHAITLPAQNTRILQLEILVHALGQTVPKQELWNQPGFMQFLALDRIEIKIGTKDIAEFATIPEEKMAQPLKLNPNNVVPLTNITSQALQMLKGKKIVALGETTHYNKAIKETTFDIMKSQILYNNCRMVLFEMPYIDGCKYNYYVSGGRITPVFTDIMEGTMRPELSISFRKFLEWLRNYNKDKKQKVMLLGMDDSHSEEFPSELDILDAAITVPSERVILTDLLDYLACGKYIQAEQEAVKQRETLVKLLGDPNYQLLSYDLHLSALNNDQSFRTMGGKYFGSLDYRHLRRDSTMFQITKKYLSWLHEGETVCMYAHFLHLTRNNTLNPRFPLGYYLNKEYGSDYFPLALLVGSGTNTMFQLPVGRVFSQKLVHFDYTLASPPENSLEKAAGKISDQRFYYPLDTTNYNLSYIRAIGSGVDEGRTEKQFKIISPKADMDGFIYIPVGTACTGFPSESSIKENDIRIHDLRYSRLRSFKKDNTYHPKSIN
ncbi:MAG TPA: erythromycin esterase family protein, partial [Paludibacter sp.]